MSVDKKFLIERQGKQVVLYQGLLDLAHEMGLVSLRSEILQFPNMDNGWTCYAMATAIFKRNGEEMIFQDFADANAGNVTPAMKNCIPRMAATRAKARCLRDGTNCGVTAFEELGDDNPEQTRTQQRTQRDEYTGSQRPSGMNEMLDRQQEAVDEYGEVHTSEPPPTINKAQASALLKAQLSEAGWEAANAQMYMEMLFIINAKLDPIAWKTQDFLDAAALPKQELINCIKAMQVTSPKAAQSPAAAIKESIKEPANVA